MAAGYLLPLRHNTGRPDIVAADQAQPGELLLLAQRDAAGFNVQVGLRQSIAMSMADVGMRDKPMKDSERSQ